MGCIRVTKTLTTRVTPARMFKALVLDSHNLLPTLMFASIKSIEFLEGNGEVGSIKQINFTEGSAYHYVKHRIDELDKENFMCKYTVIEGDVLGDVLESITYNMKFEAYGGGRCICKISSEYNTVGDVEFTEHEIVEGKDRAIGMYEVVEAYLLGHPHAYE